jgi:hypothetical protein
MTITVFIPFLPGIIFGSLLEPGGKDMNLVEFETANGVSTLVIVLLLKTNVTVWGSATLFYLGNFWISICCYCSGGLLVITSFSCPGPTFFILEPF